MCWNVELTHRTVYLTLVFIFSFFPETKEVNAVNFNWNIVIYAFVVMFATVYYFVHGKKSYVSPVTLVRKDM